ncbi:MAG: CARDB domain-containing protein [bacterium]
MAALRPSIWSRLTSPARTMLAMVKAAGTSKRQSDMIERLEDRLMLAADLTVTGTFTGATLNTAAPAALVGSFTLSNTGNASAAAFQFRVVLSEDDVYGNADDIVLTPAGGYQPVTLAAGATTPRNLADFAVPADLQPGVYTLLIRADSGGTVVENIETNNTFTGATWNVVVNGPADGPNLSSTTTFASTTVNPSQSLNITTTIRNTGTGALPSTAPDAGFSVTWALSLSSNLSSPLIEIGTDEVNSALAATTGTVTLSKTFTLPAGIALGQYYLVVLTDSNQDVSESNEGNNIQFSSAPVVNVRLPDLTGTFAVTSGTAPVAPGGSITGTLTVNNSGQAGTSYFSVSFFLRPNAASNSASDIALGTANIGAKAGSPHAVSPSSSRVIENVRLVLPFTALPGGYRLVVQVDAPNDIAETSEANNTVVSAINAVVVPARTGTDPTSADLVVFGPTTAVTATRGGELSSSLTVANLGAGPATGITQLVRVVLSRDNVLGNADDFVLNQDAFADLGGLTSLASGSLFAAGLIDVPNNAPTGQFFVILVADPNNTVAERDNANNTWISPRPLVTINSDPVGSPNIAATISFSGGSFATGTTASVPTTIQNTSTTAAASFAVRYVLSVDNIIGNADDITIGTQTIAAGLAAGATTTFTASLDIQPSFVLGSYYLAAVADSGSVLSESNEADNIAITTSASLIVARPDLRAEISASAQTVTPGNPVVANITVRNASAVQTPGFDVRVYLSADGVVNAGDVLLQTIFMGTDTLGLAANGSATIPLSVPLPTSATPGTYRLIVVADLDNVVAESNESNNTTATASALITVPTRPADPSSADLVATVSATAVTVAPTGRFNASVQVTNRGNVTTGAFAGQFFLSRDGVLSSDDVPLLANGDPSLSIDPLAPGAISGTVELTVPGFAAAGAYRLIFVADSGEAVNEPNEGNNAAVTTAAVITVVRPTVSVTASVPNAAEAVGTAAAVNGRFVFTRTGPLTSALEVNYVRTGTALTNDFSALPSTIVFAPGQSSVTVNVVPTTDNLAEQAETVILTLDRGTGYDLSTAQSTATVRIADSSPVVSVVASVPNAAEAVGATPAVNGRFVFTRTGPVTGTLVVNYVLTGTASPGTDEDFAPLPATIVFAAGQSSVTVNVNVVSDAFAEDPFKTVIVTLSSGDGYNLSTTQRAATVTIADSSPRVSVTATDAAASEVVAPAAANTGTFRITRTGSVSSALTVGFDFTGTAVIPGAGANLYTVSSNVTTLVDSGLVTIPAGQSFVDVTITPIDDLAVNTPRTVNLVLAPSGAFAYTIGNGQPTSATVTIADNEPTVSIVASRPTAGESVGTATPTTGQFTVSRVGGNLAQALTVNYTISGSATSASDYTALTGTVVIPAGQSSVAFLVTPINDTVVDAAETVVVTLTSTSSYRVAAGSAGVATVTIADSSPQITITATDAQAAETFAPAAANGGTFRLARTGGNLTQAVTVVLDITGTALIGAGNAYTLTAPTAANLVINGAGTTATVTIPAGQTSVDLSLAVISNTNVNAERTATLTIPSGTSYTRGAEATRSATVRIADNSPTVTIAATDAAASEPIGTTAANTGTFRVTRTGGNTAAALTVTIDLTGTATALVAGRDYTIATGALPAGAQAVLTGSQVALTIPAGATFADLVITPVTDTLGERGETVIATIASASTYNLGPAAQRTGTVSIADAAPVISVIASDALAAETTAPAAANTGTFLFTRTGPLTAPLTVTYAISGSAVAGTAGSNNDYVTLPGTVTFPANQATVSVPVTPIDNTTGQGTRTVTVTVADDAWAASTTQNTATVNIEDNEPRVTLAQVQPTFTEGVATLGSVRFTRPTGTAGAFELNFTLAGTATRTTDYTVAGGGVSFDGTGLGTITIPSGAASVDLTFTAVDDALAEDQETIIVDLVPIASTHRRYGVGTELATRQATLRLNDNEPTVTVTASTATAREAIGNNITTNGAFTFTRAGGSNAASLTVPYTIAGTATAGSDYTTLTGTVVIPAGSGSITVPVAVLSDAIAEDAETVIVTLAPGGTPAFRLGAEATRTATVTIQDNAPTISVSATRASAAETGPSATAQPGTFRFTRTGGNTSLAQTVSYQVTGTATNGTDYTTLSGTVVIPAGQTFVDVNVAPIADVLGESAETVIVTINPNASYRLGTQATRSATVTINNANLIDLQFASTDLAQVTTIAYNQVEVPSFSGTATIFNAGSSVTGATLTVRLSTNTTFGDADDTVLQTIALPALANGNNTQAIAFTLGQLASLLPGISYVGFVVTGPAGAADISPDNNRGSNIAGGLAPITINTLQTTPATGATVTFAVTDATAGETLAGATANPGLFTVTRTGGNLNQRLVVPYNFTTPTLPGATNGIDFARLGGLVIFEPGQTTATITLNIINDTAGEPTEEVALALVGGTGYTLSGTTTGSITILDNDA